MTATERPIGGLVETTLRDWVRTASRTDIVNVPLYRVLLPPERKDMAWGATIARPWPALLSYLGQMREDLGPRLLKQMGLRVERVR